MIGAITTLTTEAERTEQMISYCFKHRKHYTYVYIRKLRDIRKAIVLLHEWDTNEGTL